jgi:hypothetical protein
MRNNNSSEFNYTERRRCYKYSNIGFVALGFAVCI